MNDGFRADRGLIVNSESSGDDGSSSMTELRVAHRFEGPLPDPATLAAFEKAHPGAADRIFAMAEKSGDHRRAIVTEALRSEVTAKARGQIMAFAIVMTLLVGGFAMVAIGANAAGITSLVVGLGGVVASAISKLTESRKHESLPAPKDTAPLPAPAEPRRPRTPKKKGK